MFQIDESIYLLIGKHISREINEAEKQQLEQWLLASDENRNMFDRIRNDHEMVGLYQELKKLDTTKARELTWFKIRKLDKLKEEAEIRIYATMKRKIRINLMRYAAAILFLIGLGWGGYA